MKYRRFSYMDKSTANFVAGLEMLPHVIGMVPHALGAAAQWVGSGTASNAAALGNLVHNTPQTLLAVVPGTAAYLQRNSTAKLVAKQADEVAQKVLQAKQGGVDEGMQLGRQLAEETAKRTNLRNGALLGGGGLAVGGGSVMGYNALANRRKRPNEMGSDDIGYDM